MVNCILPGNNIDTLKAIKSRSINCCITSPPYYGLRDYGIDGQIGLEQTPEEYIKKLVDVFCEVRRVLRDDGTLWVNIGDSYAGSGKGGNRDKNSKQYQNKGSLSVGHLYNKSENEKQRSIKANVTRNTFEGIKQKDLIGIPWMLAFALRADGWYLRQDIIWHKPNPMPESVTDRCTKSHEYIFLLSKSARYYFDNEIIKEPCSPENIADFLNRKTLDNKSNGDGTYKEVRPDLCRSREAYMPADFKRNKRDVWTVATESLNVAHYAAFPQKLITPCILSGCPKNGIVLDPFLGSGTTAVVAIKLLRKYIGCEINPDYIKIAEQRISSEVGFDWGGA